MAFYGKYGNMSAKDAAIENLRDIEKEFNFKDFEAFNKKTGLRSEDYDFMRLLRHIEALQRVVILNGGTLPFMNLPMLYNKENENPYRPRKKLREGIK